MCWGRMTWGRHKCRVPVPLFSDGFSSCGWDQKWTFNLGPPWL